MQKQSFGYFTGLSDPLCRTTWIPDEWAQREDCIIATSGNGQQLWLFQPFSHPLLGAQRYQYDEQGRVLAITPLNTEQQPIIEQRIQLQYDLWSRVTARMQTNPVLSLQRTGLADQSR